MGMTVAERDFYNDIRQINKKMKDRSKIDWEVRRYEIAKDLYPFTLDGCRGKIEMAAKEAVDFADILIEELKNTRQDE